MTAARATHWVDATRAGLALGVVLLAAFVLTGRGLGASGAFAAVAGDAVGVVAPNIIAAPALADRMPSGVALWDDWIVLEIVGVCIGAAVSARLAGRLRSGRGAGAPPSRLVRALAGGALMGVGARLAYGCTSGLALTGGALL
ncbi:MAG: YeeE/YedE thiosulfate transporter family protein, partial [Gemmatimonadales bacterium]